MACGSVTGTYSQEYRDPDSSSFLSFASLLPQGAQFPRGCSLSTLLFLLATSKTMAQLVMDQNLQYCESKRTFPSLQIDYLSILL